MPTTSGHQQYIETREELFRRFPATNTMNNMIEQMREDFINTHCSSYVPNTPNEVLSMDEIVNNINSSLAGHVW